MTDVKVSVSIGLNDSDKWKMAQQDRALDQIRRQIELQRSRDIQRNLESMIQSKAMSGPYRPTYK